MTAPNSIPQTEEELRSRLFHLQALYDLVREIAPLRDVRAILRVSAMTVSGTLGAPASVALLKERETPRAEVVFEMGSVRDARPTLEALDLDGLGAPGKEDTVQVLCGHKGQPLDEVLFKVGLQVWVPFRIGEDVTGGLSLGPRLSGRPYSKEDLDLLETIRMTVQQALHNAFLYEALRVANAGLEEQNRELEDQVQAGTEALSTAAQSGIAGEFVGTSQALRQVQRQLAEVAPTGVNVLILGETGTGKGLAARSVHALSTHSNAPFIQVNCGALPENLVESELFGHEKGAFTGAVTRKLGKVELAKGGTLFLDEIGDMPLAAQVKLLRLLEERTFERVGGTQTLEVEVRAIGATNRNLQQMVAEGLFREDLYFRLQVFPLRLPPLRERREDLPMLADSFMKQMAAHLNKKVTRLTPEVLTLLRAYDWPGNVRELEHVVQRAVIVCRGPTIQVEDIVLEKIAAANAIGEIVPLEEYERRYIRAVLEKMGWRIRGTQGAAALLHMHESTLRSRMKKLGIERP